MHRHCPASDFFHRRFNLRFTCLRLCSGNIGIPLVGEIKDIPEAFQEIPFFLAYGTEGGNADGACSDGMEVVVER